MWLRMGADPVEKREMRAVIKGDHPYQEKRSRFQNTHLSRVASRAFITVCAGCCALLGELAIFRAAEGQEYHYAARALIPSGLDQEITRVEREVDDIERQALAEWRALPIGSSTRMQQVRVLGKLLLFDKNLSVNKNEACSFCHMPYTDFTGPISLLNQTTVSYPGSVRSRFGHRKPQSYMYAPFYPALLYNKTQNDFYGGNFWDLRATGYKLQNPAAEQAQDPPVDPNEMALPDPAVRSVPDLPEPVQASV